MEEKITVQNNDLEKAVGGNEVLFHEGKPVCPICGKYPIPLVSGDEFTCFIGKHRPFTGRFYNYPWFSI